MAAAKKQTKKKRPQPAQAKKKKREPAHGGGLGAHKHGRTAAEEPAPRRRDGQLQGKRPRYRMGERNARILRGEEDLSEWSDEELLRGHKMDRNGHFRGRPPKLVPKALHDELVRRTLEAANEELRSNLVAAVEALTGLVGAEDVEAKDKIKAIEIVMNRVMGKAPEKVEISATVKPYEEALRGGVVRDIPEDEDE